MEADNSRSLKGTAESQRIIMLVLVNLLTQPISFNDFQPTSLIATQHANEYIVRMECTHPNSKRNLINFVAKLQVEAWLYPNCSFLPGACA